jgi:ferredoxin
VKVPSIVHEMSWYGNKAQGGGFVLRVDPILCDGFGHCHELAPELVQVDEWGYPIIKSAPRRVSDATRSKSARLAVRGCPRQALRIERTATPTPRHRAERCLLGPEAISTKVL